MLKLAIYLQSLNSKKQINYEQNKTNNQINLNNIKWEL